jgi:hypothetical protein
MSQQARTHAGAVSGANPLLRLLTQALLPASSAPVDARPFLENRTGKLRVEERMAGLLYLVWGCPR